MALNEAETGRERLGVWRMALALAVAAFLGGGLGLVWQSTGLGDDDEAADSADSADSAGG